MKAAVTPTHFFKSISELMRALGMPKPLHPLIALVSHGGAGYGHEYAGHHFLIDFYKVSFKKNFRGQVKYGQGYYDFEEGGLAFLGPNQLVAMPAEQSGPEDCTLYFHGDLIRNYQLGNHIRQYGFFSYAVNEALFLSEKEKTIISGIFENIALELATNTDAYSQDVLVSMIELLLNYSNRFYNRQFLTRKAIHHDLISRMDTYLDERFSSGTGLPTVQEVSDHLHVSARCLTDMLRTLTGQSTQQRIHEQLVDKAKHLLSTGSLSVAEIAYTLGFEHPQSFHRLFKRTTSLSPLAFRQSFN